MIISFLITFLSLSVFAQVSSFDYEVLQDPAISRKCKALIDKRNNKILMTQKLKSLMSRNERLQAKLRPTQKLLEQKLLISKNELRRELGLSLEQVETMEENIIRSGCPGVSI